jgi:excisionase family DNA binding protein
MIHHKCTASRVVRRTAMLLGMVMAAERMLTVEDIADRLSVNPETVRRWIRGGQLKAVLIGGRKTGFRVAESEVDRFLRDRQYRPDPD